MKTYYCVVSSYNDRGLAVANIVDTKEAEEKPEDTYNSTPRKDIYITWYESLEEAQQAVEAARATNL